MRAKLLNGETLNFTSKNEDNIKVWFNKTWRTFILKINGSSVFGYKNYEAFNNKLNNML